MTFTNRTKTAVFNNTDKLYIFIGMGGNSTTSSTRFNGLKVIYD